MLIKISSAVCLSLMLTTPMWASNNLSQTENSNLNGSRHLTIQPDTVLKRFFYELATSHVVPDKGNEYNDTYDKNILKKFINNYSNKLIPESIDSQELFGSKRRQKKTNRKHISDVFSQFCEKHRATETSRSIPLGEATKFFTDFKEWNLREIGIHSPFYIASEIQQMLRHSRSVEGKILYQWLACNLSYYCLETSLNARHDHYDKLLPPLNLTRTINALLSSCYEDKDGFKEILKPTVRDDFENIFIKEFLWALSHVFYERYKQPDIELTSSQAKALSKSVNFIFMSNRYPEWQKSFAKLLVDGTEEEQSGISKLFEAMDGGTNQLRHFINTAFEEEIGNVRNETVPLEIERNRESDEKIEIEKKLKNANNDYLEKTNDYFELIKKHSTSMLQESIKLEARMTTWDDDLRWKSIQMFDDLLKTIFTKSKVRLERIDSPRKARHHYVTKLKVQENNLSNIEEKINISTQIINEKIAKLTERKQQFLNSLVTQEREPLSSSENLQNVFRNENSGIHEHEDFHHDENRRDNRGPHTRGERRQNDSHNYHYENYNHNDPYTDYPYGHHDFYDERNSRDDRNFDNRDPYGHRDNRDIRESRNSYDYERRENWADDSSRSNSRNHNNDRNNNNLRSHQDGSLRDYDQHNSYNQRGNRDLSSIQNVLRKAYDTYNYYVKNSNNDSGKRHRDDKDNDQSPKRKRYD